MNDFAGDCPPTLEDLKEKLESGDSSFIDKLMYFGKVVPGSSAYWKGKKSELYSWINHHIQKGRCAQTLFLTLSCAEHFWPDLKCFLGQKIFLCEDRAVDLDNNKGGLSNALNDHTIVAQEFFHERVEKFLEHIGLKVLGITHYWGFEFAKSHGQIHLHLLGIIDNVNKENGR